MKKLLGSTALTLLLATAAHADIVSTVGLVPIAAPTGKTVQADWIPINGLPPQLIFAEQQGVTLAAPLATDTGTIAAGTVIDSFFMGLGTHDFVTYPNGMATTDVSVTFDGMVLGIIYLGSTQFQASPNFAASDFLGAPNTNYQESACPTLGFGCAFETSIIPGYTDTASFLGNTASFHNDYFYPGDVARVITGVASVPGPTVGAGLPGLLAMFGSLLLWRRRWMTSLA